MYIYICIYILCIYIYIYLCWWALLDPVATLLWLWSYLVLVIGFLVFESLLPGMQFTSLGIVCLVSDGDVAPCFIASQQRSLSHLERWQIVTLITAFFRTIYKLNKFIHMVLFSTENFLEVAIKSCP